MRPKGSESARAIRRLLEEIATLTLLQREALQRATFLGMSPSEASEFDERRGRIGTMLETLRLLRDTDENPFKKESAEGSRQ